MTRYEIILNVNGEQRYLETYDYEPISLNYNIADIQDVGSRNAAFSKTIKIPDTRNNRDVFGDIGDLSIVDSTFNPNLKTRCWILVDTVVVFRGFLQVKSIIEDRDFINSEYECVVYAENDNLFKLIGDSFLTDLDWSELNHTWNEPNITKSWTQSWNHGYFYPLIDYGYNWDYEDIRYDIQFLNANNYVRVEQMFPATNVKYTLDKIFSEYGFRYQSNFLDSAVFEDLYMPYNRGPLLRPDDSIDGKFSVGFINTFTFSFATNQSFTGPVGRPLLITILRPPFNNESAPYGDPNNLYNTSTFFFTAPATPINARFVYNFDILFAAGTPNYTAQTFAGSGLFATSICFRREFSPTTGLPIVGGSIIPINGSVVPIPFTTTAIPGLTFPTPNRAVGQISTPVLDNSLVLLRPLYPNERLYIEIRYSLQRPAIGPIIIAANAPVLVLSTINNFFTVVSPNILPGEIIPYGSCIPFNFKQRDFILSLVRMFNLYIEPSKDEDNFLIIEPRNEFYAAGAVKDWTYKLDITNIEGQVLGETQNRRTIFKYKDDTDYFNTDYRDAQAGVSYGEYDHLLDNDFVNGEKKIELSFSPTPVAQVPDSNLIVIPKIVKLNNNVFQSTAHNVRILTRKRSRLGPRFNFNAYLISNTLSNVVLADLTLTTPHGFQVGDIISVFVAQNVTLQTIFEVVAIISPFRVEINITGSEAGGAGAVTPGSATPISGLLSTGSNRWGFVNQTATTHPFAKHYRAYPYLGHLNDPFNPTYDINYGQVVGYYYPEESTTNANLFQTYWSNFIAEISDKDSRLIKAKFYLTALDISDFSFSDNIFINNQYYRVNKINDYDPGVEKTTTVELIKSKFINLPEGYTFSNSERPFDVGVSTTDPVRGNLGVGLSTTSANVSIRNNVLVNGKYNYIGGNRVFVNGSNNIVAASNVSVLGSNNLVGVDTTNSLVVGSNNMLGAGAVNSFVLGSNQQISESNSFVTNAKVIISADLIDAGRDEVLNPFPDNKIINLVSASVNVVRQPGSADVVNVVSGRRIDLGLS